MAPGQTGVRVRAKNACGWGEWAEFPFEIIEIPNPQLRQAAKVFQISPNPTSEILNVSIKDKNILPSKNATIIASLFDMMGIQKEKVSVVNNTATINVANLPKGIYVLKINIDDIEETHQVSVQ
jgi:hypothetical protein